MNENLKHFNQNINEILNEARERDYPHAKLIEYRQELDKFIEQENCPHLETETVVRNNVRFWICKKCKKIMNYESIESIG